MAAKAIVMMPDHPQPPQRQLVPLQQPAAGAAGNESACPYRHSASIRPPPGPPPLAAAASSSSAAASTASVRPRAVLGGRALPLNDDANVVDLDTDAERSLF